jgi:cytidyltransferase-like protein
LDTRAKIVDALPEDASNYEVIVGYFDPMHAGHTRRLRELCGNGDRLVVAIADPPEPILPVLARAELLAGLECVAYVLTDTSQVPSRAIDDRPLDSERARIFAQHVLARYNTK